MVRLPLTKINKNNPFVLLPTLPEKAKLGTIDANSMYTNIDSKHAIKVIANWFETFSSELPLNFPSNLIIKVLNVVMHNNIFQFGDTWWKQKIGTAMGTSCACIYSTIYYAYHERTLLLEKYKNNIIYYKRFIDDIFLIWKPTINQTWKNFYNDLPFGKLTWATPSFGDTAIFLDLEINIKNRKLETKTYQKPLNLYLYLPPQSSHPPSTLKSLIYGNLRRFWIQCSKLTDYIDLAKKFFLNLLARGNDRKKITELFKECARSLDHNPPTTIRTKSRTQYINKKKTLFNKQTMIYHTTYHPQNIPRKYIQRAYQDTCKDLPCTSNLIICYHRPKNIRDVLIPSRLHNSKEYANPSSYLCTYR